MSVFTPEEVINLMAYQRRDDRHQFTCVNRDRATHPMIDGEFGVLVPTVRGWICPFCDYTQDWAHDFMKKSQS